MPTASQKAEKAALRARFNGERQALPVALRAEKSRALCAQLAAWLKPLARTVMLYHAVKGEADLGPLTEILSGVEFGLPVLGKARGEMAFHRFRAGDPLTPNRFGILEPTVSSASPLVVDDRSIVLAPALAIDRSGVRLGYGGGYYDRLFATFAGVAVGIVYSEFVVDALPCESHDVRLPFRATEAGVFPSLSRPISRGVNS